MCDGGSVKSRRNDDSLLLLLLLLLRARVVHSPLTAGRDQRLPRPAADTAALQPILTGRSASLQRTHQLQ
jgi:hypothetical protein